MCAACRDFPQSIAAAERSARARPRRPIAAVFRVTASGAAVRCTRWAVSPSHISLAGLAVGAAAGLCLLAASRSPWLLIAAPPLFTLRLWLNMLDGMVAFAAGRASDRGWFVNEVTDVLADLVIFIGVANSGLCPNALGYGAALAALLASHLGVLGEAIGVGREYSGLMSKPIRTLVLGLGCVAQLFHPAALSTALALIIVGCAQTAAARWVRIGRRLQVDDFAGRGV